MQEIGDIDRLIGSGSCLLRERALAALRVSPQLGTLLAELAEETRAELRSMTIGGDGASDIVGKSVVVHADPDDFRTQPAGNSGARVACGVIK